MKLASRPGIGAVACVCGVMLGGFAGAAGARAATLSIRIVGNHFVNQDGQTIQLRGIDQPGNEYACEQGWEYQGDTAANVALEASWDVNVVRLPLNEDCWLGINGKPAYGTAAGYQQMIERYVSELNAAGIYTILDLHWSAPGADAANGQQAMPDSHSVAFWTSVAATFASDPAVIFDVFNEPFSPALDGHKWSAYPVSWSCWLNGGCRVPDSNLSKLESPPRRTYTAVGMQALVTAIRQAGGTQPIMVGGLSYANDLSQWLAYEPSDPENQLAASFHNYQGQTCGTEQCWDTEVTSVAAQVPVVTGEFDQTECAAHKPDTSDDWDETYMNWADQHGISYLGWGWFVDLKPNCGTYYLLNANGTPAAPNGIDVYDHLTGTCVVPALVGAQLGIAEDRLRGASCKLGKVRGQARTNRRRPGRLVVAASSPRAGRHVPADQAVSLRLKLTSARR